MKQDRILSMDVFRGFTMFLLIGEFTGLFEHLADESFKGTFLYGFALQLQHHPWNGLRFWDLIQPYFMFIVGLALPFAVQARQSKGESWIQIRNHVWRRSLILLLLGWALYCIGPGEIRFRFQNVLAQIAFTYLIAFLLMRWAAHWQIVASLILLIITESAYRFFPLEGFDQAFVMHKNFGTWLDLQYGGADLNGGWVSFNAVPTAAHTIWGVVCGQLLMRPEKTKLYKLGVLLIAGIMLVVLGYILDPVTPIIKRISTSTFVLVSGGWSLLTLAFWFALVDYGAFKGKWTLFFSVVSMNSLFIYLFAHLDGSRFIEPILHPFTYAFFSEKNALSAEILTALLVWFCLWVMCYWMYVRKIFVKI